MRQVLGNPAHGKLNINLLCEVATKIVYKSSASLIDLETMGVSVLQEEPQFTYGVQLGLLDLKGMDESEKILKKLNGRPDGLKTSSYGEHLKELGVVSSEKSIPSDAIHFFQNLQWLIHRVKGCSELFQRENPAPMHRSNREAHSVSLIDRTV